MLGMPSSMLSQIGSMSDSDKEALAKQYGIELDNLSLGQNINSDDQLGKSSGEITSDVDQILVDRILDSEENKIKAEKYKKRFTPLFETNYESLDDLPIYGKFLFEDEYSTFAPVDNAPIPSDYLIGTGDTLRVLLV